MKLDQLHVPVALIVFNRPHVTRRVFDAIARARPSRLYVIADAARPDQPGEAERVSEVRSIVEAVDWPCEVFRNYAVSNLGCRLRVSSGISWLFDKEDEAIILEDDCLPSLTFFKYCVAMLDYYRDDHRVFSISGSNFSGTRSELGHYFSNYSLMWGWATWRNRWAFYDVLPKKYFRVLIKMWLTRPVALAYWLRIYFDIAAGKIDTWDYQWMLTIWRCRGLVCRPTVNLVENVGFGTDATHTLNPNSELAGLTAVEADNSFLKLVGPSNEADTKRDSVDERVWALISLRSVLLMYFPWINRFRSP